MKTFHLVASTLLLTLLAPISVSSLLKVSVVRAQTAVSEERQAEADRLLKQGRQQYQTSQFREALQSWEEALKVYREIGDRRGVATSLNNLGVAYRSLGQYQQALDYYQQSLALNREMGDRRGVANSLNSLGLAYFSLGQYQQAIDYYQQSLAIAREIDDRQGVATSLNNLGLAFLNTDRLNEAKAAYFEAVAVYESLRAGLGDTDKVSLTDTQARAYVGLQQVLVALGETTSALEVAERGRARALVELMSAKLSTSAPAVSANPSLRLEAFPDAQRIRQIAQEQNATLVEYSLVADALYIWVVQPTGEIAFRSLDFAADTDTPPSAPSPTSAPEEETLRRLVSQTRASVVVTSEANPVSQAQYLQQAHQLLIDPIADLLPDDPQAKVIFIPQGSLFLVPFAALQDQEGTYLIEKHTILTAPAIQVLDLTRTLKDRRANAPLDSLSAPLVVGNPTMPTLPSQPLSPLPGAEREALAIAELYQTQALIGAQATEAAVVEQMSNARLIHLATHGLLDYGLPQASGVRDVPGAIALAPSQTADGLLTSGELLDLSLKAELVVLSACDTGRGRLSSDGVIGLSRSLMIAGVPSVIVSLWSVPDAPTAELMVEFYRQLEQNPDKARALRQAMLTTLRSYPEPTDWAAFTLIGEAQ